MTQFSISSGMDDLSFNVSDLHTTEAVFQALKAANLQPKKINAPEAKEKKQGVHWVEKRAEILSAALQVINDSSSDDNRAIWIESKNERRINATKLAEEIDDNRHRWSALKDEPVGTSLKNTD
jgi:hypothetical protein